MKTSHPEIAKPEMELTHAPPFLLAAGLLLWGWQTGFIIYALIMAILLEAVIWTKWRWQISDREFNQIADLSSLIFFVVVVYVFIKLSAHGIFTILKLLPFLLFLLVLAQVYSEHGKIRLSALFISLRKVEPDDKFNRVTDIDVTLPYLFICMVSASAGNQYPIAFFIIICLLTGWLLWNVRPKCYHFLQWITWLCLAIGLAYISQSGIQQLHKQIEITFMDWFDQFAWRTRDPYSTTTAIGSVGRLKMSDRIMLRVKTDNKLKTPILLREATYDSYGYGIWSNHDTDFFVIDPDLSSNQWVFNKQGNSSGYVTISSYLNDDRGIVPMPHGSDAITRGTAILQVENNPFGSVRIESRPGWINYDVTFTENIIHDIEPYINDLEIPPQYADDFKRLVSELELNTKTDEEIVQIVESFFRDNFYYSLVNNQRYTRGKYLSKFLFKNRKGHCEYFATATALLLRAAGIPTRYAVGYSIQEYSPLEKQYIARARHAHSWVLYNINQRWHTLDTTPAIWAPLEAEDSSLITPLIDFWSWLKYRFSDGNAEEVGEDSSTMLLWLLIPMFAFLGWRIYFNKRINKKNIRQNSKTSKFLRMGLDSGFYAVIRELEKQGDIRRRGETLSAWINRIRFKQHNDKLMRAMALHNRYRFDPGSKKESDKSELDILAQTILDESM